MAKRLSDRDIKAMIALYIEGESMRSLSRRFHVAASTVKRAIDRSEGVVERAREKQEANTLEMLAFMDSRKQKAQSFIDQCFESLQDEEKFQKASLQQIATSLGIIVDKFTSIQKSDEATQDDRLRDIAAQLRKVGMGE